MPSFTYLPGPEDPDTTQTLGYSFTAGEWTPVPDDHAAIEKLRGNRFFAEQGEATNGNISPAPPSVALLTDGKTERASAELHNSGSGGMVANGSVPLVSYGRPAPGDLSPTQCRAARAGLEWSREQLAKAAKLGERTITDFERGASTMLAPNKARLCAALEAAGVTFDGSTGLWFTEPAAVATAENSEAPDAQNSVGATLD